MLFHTLHNFRFEECVTYLPPNIYPFIILEAVIHRSLRSYICDYLPNDQPHSYNNF